MAGPYVEKRSKHALRIDRALKAKVRHSKFNDDYKKDPANSDVEGYDTPAEKRPPTKARVYLESNKGEYLPSVAEKRKLIAILKKKLREDQQIKDVLRTTRVVKTKKQLSAWKKNPRDGDIRGIDTAPDLIDEQRFKFIKKVTGNPEVEFINRKNKSLAGDVRFGPQTRRGKYAPDINFPGYIRVFTKDKAKKSIYRTSFHELGHVFDRNVKGPLVNKGVRTRGTGNFSFNAVGDDYKKSKAKRKAVFDVTSKYINPFKLKNASYSYVSYRGSSEELFADWFSGFVQKRNVVKKRSKGFYKDFTKEFKPFARELKKTEKRAAKKYISII